MNTKHPVFSASTNSSFLSTESVQGTLPTISCETRFNQGYRIAAPSTGIGQIVAANDSAGNMQLFTFNSSGNVVNIYEDNTSDTGFSWVTTSLTGSYIATGFNADALMVFAYEGLNLSYITETSEDGQWTDATPFALPAMPNAAKIVNIKVFDTISFLFSLLIENNDGTLQWLVCDLYSKDPYVNQPIDSSAYFFTWLFSMDYEGNCVGGL